MSKPLIYHAISAFVALTMSACNVEPEHQISLNSSDQYGFTENEIIALGRLVLIDYALFEGNPEQHNPSFSLKSKGAESAGLLADDSALVGYVPVLNIQGQDRLGSREEFYGHVWRTRSGDSFVISIRGTSDRQEWIDDAKFELTPLMPSNTKSLEPVAVELGFHEVQRTLTVSKPESDTRAELHEYIQSLPPESSLTIVGHSLGSSIATLLAYKARFDRSDISLKLLTFASPLTGAPSFSDSFQGVIKNSIRLVNRPDIVPRLPFPELGYEHVWHELQIDSSKRSDIVDSIACHHSLNTYLHLLDEKVGLSEGCIKELSD